MKLKELLKNVKVEKIINEKDVDIDGISYNSKTIKNGDIFVCLKGEYSDGHDFAKMAQQNLLQKAAKVIEVPAVVSNVNLDSKKELTSTVDWSIGY